MNIPPPATPAAPPLPSLLIGPPERPEDPQDAAIYDIKEGLIAIMQVFKAGLFRDRITWKAKLVDIFDIVLASPDLNKGEKTHLARVAEQVRPIKEAPNVDHWKFHESLLESHRTMQLLRATVAVECAARGHNVQNGWLREVGLDTLSFEVDFNGCSPAQPAKTEQNLGDFLEPAALIHRPMSQTQMPGLPHAASGNIQPRAPSGVAPVQTPQFGGTAHTTSGSFQQPAPVNAYRQTPQTTTGIGSMNIQSQNSGDTAMQYMDDTEAGPSGWGQDPSQGDESRVQSAMRKAWPSPEQPN
ncbi:hypothetical protein H2200_011755 [Cladophialophora chaetospira]|uniref:Uncharacterized protein n=1 Tax=Cladophialophora chaetospira TaxID=386627 RepID=A0AA38WYM8_9EURO|nr:hypothetical protein H2200_011755 [Cladophialophora chaetospira]